MVVGEEPVPSSPATPPAEAANSLSLTFIFLSQALSSHLTPPWRRSIGRRGRDTELRGNDGGRPWIPLLSLFSPGLSFIILSFVVVDAAALFCGRRHSPPSTSMVVAPFSPHLGPGEAPGDEGSVRPNQTRLQPRYEIDDDNSKAQGG